MSGAAPSSLVCLGVIVAAHGVRGQVRVKSFTEEPRALTRYGPLTDAEGGRRFRLAFRGLAKDGVVLAAIDGVEDRDGAEALKGTRLFVERSALPPTADEDEFYHADLIGLAVELADGTRLGRVAAVHDFGAGDVLEVAGDGGAASMLPFTREVVPLVDLAAGRLVADPPDGLLEDAADGLLEPDDGADDRKGR